MHSQIILASGSPRRVELMSLMGLPFQAVSVDVDEHTNGTPEDVVLRLAERKARAAQALHPREWIVGADTVVWAEGSILGKPRDAASAFTMLSTLEGRDHSVFTGVCLLHGSMCLLRYEQTRVQFVPMDKEAIDAYISTGEPFGKAGAYAVQGMGGMFVSAVTGSPSNVIGLPMHTLRAMLEEAGYYTTIG